MLNIVGNTAGDIWSYLNDKNKEVSFASIKKDLELKPDMAALALGWLAREGKIEINKSGASLKIKLS